MIASAFLQIFPKFLLDRVYGGSHRFPCSGRKQAQAKGFMEASWTSRTEE
jgi:hypothetical protein